MDDSTPVLRMQGVCRRFGQQVTLDGLDLTLHAGDVYALLAPNGSGKTTTINLILGFLRPDAGTISVCGAPAGKRESIAYLPELVAMYPELSGVENLRYFSLMAGLMLDDARLRLLLSQAGLPAPAHDRSAGTYSKGMRQKVGIAIALAREARLLLLDEPTSGLDPLAAADLSASLRAAAARGMAILMATHDLYRIREVATRVGVLHGGRIVRELDPQLGGSAALEQLYVRQMTA